MKKGLLSVALIAATLFTLSAKKSAEEPVLMTVDNKPVTLSEFEYLYHKNNSQQLAPQTIDEYLDMFVAYKLKVAGAEAAGIDTTARFRAEFDGYRKELAAPYLVDNTVEDKLVHDIYERMKEDVEVSHIMLDRNAPDARAKADSLRAAVAGGADFAEAAARYSIDRTTNGRGGYMGFISVGRYPYTFEDAAFNTKPGEISDVVETAYGYHIVKVSDRRPTLGKVLVEHILKLTVDLRQRTPLSDEERAAKKASIDSIYALLKSGADFSEIARRESEDPGSARDGGKLPWFGRGQMVKPFEEASFALANGEISEPVETDYGYHIIHRLDWKPVEEEASVTPQIKAAIAQDERSLLPKKAKYQQLLKKYDGKVNDKTAGFVEAAIRQAGGYDTTVYNKFATTEWAIATVGDIEIPLSKVISTFSPMAAFGADRAVKAFHERIDEELQEVVFELERQSLAQTNSDYRNLLNEYRDGILLFEISDRNVWSKAKEDKAGLENYFQTHREKYHWDNPKFKGYIVFATGDSILQAAQQYLDGNQVADESLVQTLRGKFGREVKVERVIASKGENPIVDYIGFGGEKPAPTGKWSHYFAYKGKIIDQPEEAADERGAITADYQSELEQQWLTDLKKQHKVKINKKVLKQVK